MNLLKIDWATYQAAEYACKNWHYSKCIPSTGLVKVGVWEENKFIGCVIFSHGSQYEIGTPYGLSQFECVELTRIALTKHKTAVSRIMALALKFLKKQSPKLRLVVSYADPLQGHHGGIYQATNWIYQGQINEESYLKVNGKLFHRRSLYSKYGTSSVPSLRKKGLKIDVVMCPGKHKYIFALDDEMKSKCLNLSKPYPKRPKPSSEAPSDQEGQRQCDSDQDAPKIEPAT